MFENLLKKSYFWVCIALFTVIVLFYAVIPIFANYGDYGDLAILQWASESWNADNNYEHGWFVIPGMFVFYWMAWKPMNKEVPTKNSIGWVVLFFGILCYYISIRSLQPRIALIGLPFIISGAVLQLFGWKVARHILFASFFLYFAIPMPGLQHATNGLQLFVSDSCYSIGKLFGMDLIREGNTIKSASGSWNALDIAEGCSGIRSLIALVMISAIFAYYTQKTFLKKLCVFSLSFPLAVVGNFFRIFTIIVLAEMGYPSFAAGVYHDWAGMLIFFPVALAGLFLADRLLNSRKKRKVTSKTIH